MNGYDIDGVLTAGIKPQEPFEVVSGRLLDTLDETIQFLDSIGIKKSPYLRQDSEDNRFNHQRSGEHKARLIKELGITHYYEDVKEQAKVIKEFNPDCEITLVINGKEEPYA